MTEQSKAYKWTDDGELIVVPLAEWDAPILSDFEVERIAERHLNDESGCRSGPCPGDNGQVWCDAAMLLVSLHAARTERDTMADSHETLLAAAEALVADAESWETIYTNPNVPQTAEEYVDIRMAVVDQLRAAIRKARGDS